MSALKQFVDEIIEDGIITAEEHQQFTDLVHEDGEIDAEESEQISRIFRLVSEGKVRIVDEERNVASREELEQAKAEVLAEDEAKAEESHFIELDHEALAKRKAEIAKVIAELNQEREAGRNKISEFLENHK